MEHNNITVEGCRFVAVAAAAASSVVVVVVVERSPIYNRPFNMRVYAFEWCEIELVLIIHIHSQRCCRKYNSNNKYELMQVNVSESKFYL